MLWRLKVLGRRRLCSAIEDLALGGEAIPKGVEILRLPLEQLEYGAGGLHAVGPGQACGIVAHRFDERLELVALDLDREAPFRVRERVDSDLKRVDLFNGQAPVAETREVLAKRIVERRHPRLVLLALPLAPDVLDHSVGGTAHDGYTRRRCNPNRCLGILLDEPDRLPYELLCLAGVILDVSNLKVPDDMTCPVADDSSELPVLTPSYTRLDSGRDLERDLLNHCHHPFYAEACSWQPPLYLYWGQDEIGDVMNNVRGAREMLHEFAMKWIPRFEDWGYNQLFETMEFSDDCRALGFEMDGGQAFTDAFPGCFRDPVATEAAIARCDDAELLGSGLFSGWRYYNHWNAFGGFKPEERAWFGMVLRRLAELSA